MTPLLCPRCGNPMNRHAEKLVAPIDASDAAAVDPALGGILEEVYACPRCGMCSMRRVVG